jgi:hypothetical protein
MPDGPMTPAQWKLAKKLGLIVPDGTTKWEFSSLVENYNNDEEPAGSLPSAYAEYYGWKAGRFVSERNILAGIFSYLRDAGNCRGLCEWFTFRVAVQLGFVHKTEFPPDNRILDAANIVLADEKAVRSIKRYCPETSFFSVIILMMMVFAIRGGVSELMDLRSLN